jgi:hypothetical protein
MRKVKFMNIVKYIPNTRTYQSQKRLSTDLRITKMRWEKFVIPNNVNSYAVHLFQLPT